MNFQYSYLDRLKRFYFRAFVCVCVSASFAGGFRPVAHGDDKVGAGRDLPAIVHLYLNQFGNAAYVSEPRLREHIGDPEMRTEKDLVEAQQLLARLRKRVDQSWVAIQAAREMRKPVAQADWPILFLRVSALLRERDAELVRLKDLENEQCRAAHWQHVYGWLAVDAPKANAARAEWLRSDAHKNFVAQQEAVNSAYQARLQKLLSNWNKMTDETEISIDELQESVLNSYQVVTRWNQRVAEALKKRREGIPPSPSAAENGEIGGRLTLTVPQRSFEIKVSQTVVSNLEVAGGKPPYRITVSVLSGENNLEVTVASPGLTSLPFTFKTPGYRTATVIVDDSSMPRRQEQLTLDFRVVEAEEGEPENWPMSEKEPAKPEAGNQSSGGTQEPGQSTGETTPDPVPPPLSPGLYQAELWVPGLIESPGFIYAARARSNQVMEPHPLVLAVDVLGNISGECSYVFPKNKYAPKALEQWHDIHWEGSFKLDGSYNTKTGEAEFAIKSGRIENYVESERPNERSNFRIGHKIHYSAQLSGWRIPGPLTQADLQAMTNHSEPAPPLPQQDRRWQAGPLVIVQAADGHLRIHGDGWFGIHWQQFPGIAKHDRAGTVTMESFTNFTSGRKYEQWDNSEIKQLHEETKGKVFWLLKIIGPVEEEIEPPKGDLVGYGLWPKSPLHVAPGAEFQVEPVGIFAKELHKIVRLTRESHWMVDRRLIPTRGIKGGFFRAPEDPGTYEIAVKILHADGTWMSDRIQIIVASKAG